MDRAREGVEKDFLMHAQPEPVKGECNALKFCAQDFDDSVIPDSVYWVRCFLFPDHEGPHTAQIPGVFMVMVWQ